MRENNLKLVLLNFVLSIFLITCIGQNKKNISASLQKNLSTYLNKNNILDADNVLGNFLGYDDDEFEKMVLTDDINLNINEYTSEVLKSYFQQDQIQNNLETDNIEGELEAINKTIATTNRRDLVKTRSDDDQIQNRLKLLISNKISLDKITYKLFEDIKQLEALLFLCNELEKKALNRELFFTICSSGSSFVMSFFLGGPVALVINVGISGIIKSIHFVGKYSDLKENFSELKCILDKFRVEAEIPDTFYGNEFHKDENDINFNSWIKHYAIDSIYDNKTIPVGFLRKFYMKYLFNNSSDEIYKHLFILENSNFESSIQKFTKHKIFTKNFQKVLQLN